VQRKGTHLKKRALKNKALGITFNEKDLKDYVTGFHKRKKKRRKEAQKQQDEALRRKRSEERKKVFTFAFFYNQWRMFGLILFIFLWILLSYLVGSNCFAEEVGKRINSVWRCAT